MSRRSRAEVIAAICRLPLDHRTGARSRYGLFRASGFFSLPQRPTEAEFATYLREHPELIREWWILSGDQRSSEGLAYEDKRLGEPPRLRWHIYYFGGRTPDPGELFDDEADACAHYVRRYCDMRAERPVGTWTAWLIDLVMLGPDR